MQNSTPRLIVLSILATAGLFAQSLAGIWQGTVRPPDTKADLRTILKITDDGGTLKANFYSIDQTLEAFPSTVTVQGSNVRITIPGLGTGFEGKLSADGNTIAGTIKRGFTETVPWILKRVSEQEAWTIPTRPAPPKPMADADPVFEVDTVKLTPPGATGRGMRVQGRTISIVNLTLADLVTFSYDVHVRQLIGLPAWAESEHYDITAKPEGEGQPTSDQWRLMIQKLLANRFQLAIRRETREIPVYTVTVARGGSKILKAVNPDRPPNIFFRSPGNISATSATPADLAALLQRSVLDRPAVDQTGLSDRCDFTLIWTPDQLAPAAVPPTTGPALGGLDAPPDLFTAIQQQLGLKLDGTKTALSVLVIEKAEKPSEN